MTWELVALAHKRSRRSNRGGRPIRELRGSLERTWVAPAIEREENPFVTPDDETGEEIFSFLKGVGLSPSGDAPGMASRLFFCLFKSSAGGTPMEKEGSYRERIELAGMSCIS